MRNIYKLFKKLQKNQTIRFDKVLVITEIQKINNNIYNEFSIKYISIELIC